MAKTQSNRKGIASNAQKKTAKAKKQKADTAQHKPLTQAFPPNEIKA
jgi:hypothetical protein